MIFAIDFDGTIHDNHSVPGHKMGRPIEGSQIAIRQLVKDGHEVFVHTHRAETDVKHVEKWLAYFGFPRMRVVPKPYADVYIDDKGLKFQGWEPIYLRYCR